MKTTKKMLIVIVFAVMAYTIASFILAFRGIEISPQLTISYFGFWGVEIVAMAGITTSKVKNPNNDEYIDNEIQPDPDPEGEPGAGIEYEYGIPEEDENL